MVDRALATGQLLLPRRGIVIVGDLPSVLVHAVAGGGVLSCLSAAQAHDRQVLNPASATHIVVSRDYHAPAQSGVVVHRRAALSDGLLTTLEQTGRTAPSGRSALAAADGRSQSNGETVVRVTLAQVGIDAEPQAWIACVGCVDLLVDGWLVIEVDGLAYHSDAAAFANDRRRDAELLRRGYRVLRITWRDAVRRPEWVVATVQHLLATQGRTAPTATRR